MPRSSSNPSETMSLEEWKESQKRSREAFNAKIQATQAYIARVKAEQAEQAEQSAQDQALPEYLANLHISTPKTDERKTDERKTGGQK
ncbi:hypothetical protein K3495_g955 [Podosphaera aphanis]|nr:hypothetical protein K3495_g955 [Podosphaera aphanis]